MPKEIVYADSLPYGEQNAARSVVEVGWHRDAAHVQLATRCVRGEGDDMTYVNTEIPTLTAAEGWYIDLDRDAINTLIRHLRRARDQAFGRDE